MAIKEFVSLEGVDEVLSRYKELKTGGESTAQAISDIGGGAGEGLAPVTVNIQQARAAMGAAEGSTRSLTEAMRVLRPALQEAGLAMGNMRELSVLARAGIEGLAIALTGAALIALAKLADQAAITKGKLGDLLGSQAAGATAFGKLEQDAEKLGTTVENLVPTFTTLQRVLTDTSSIHFFAAPGQELPAFLSNAGKAEKAATDLFTALRFGRASFDEATKASQAFADALEKSGGKITSAMLIPIRRDFPAAFEAIKNALGGAGATVTKFFADLDAHPKTIEQLDGAFQQLARQIPETFDPSKPQSFSDALTIVGNQIKAALAIQQPKAFEDAIAKLGPAIAGVVAELVKISPQIFEFLAADLIKLNNAISATFVDVQNLSIIFAAAKDVIDKFFTAPPAEFFAAFQKLQNIFAEIGRTGAAPGVATDKLKQAFSDAAKEAGGVGTAVQSAEQKTTQADTAVDAYKNSWNAANQAVQNVAKSVDQVSKGPKFVEAPAPGVDPFAKAAAAAPAAQAVTALQEAKNQITQIWSEIVAIIKPEQIAAALDPLAQDLPAPFEIAADVIDGVFAGIVRAAQQMAADIANAAQQAALSLQKLQSGGGGGGGGPNFSEIPLASGGLITGPGSPTSDSIIARLSNFEYVVRAAAVKFYGVDFMHALNAMRLPKDFFRGFNLGGLVLPPFPSPPRFAQGGLAMAGQSRSLTLVLDGRSFAVAGAKNTVDELERAADLHNLSRMGRAPGWVR
jgi:hypothetical protein